MEIAVIICFREREEQLRYLLYYLFPLLQKQQHTFSIYLIEQDFPDKSKDSGDSEKALFNRAKLFNVGYAEAIKENPNFNCFTFHDVDLIAENENVTYSCHYKNPRHLSSSINKQYTTRSRNKNNNQMIRLTLLLCFQSIYDIGE